MYKYLPIILNLLLGVICNAQQTIVIQPGPCDGKSAYLGSYQPTTNAGGDEELDAFTWTCNSTPCTARTVFQFDLGSIPQGSTINSAYLSLWHNGTTTGNNLGQQGSNAFHIYPVSASWGLHTVTWSTQPAYDSIGAYAGAASTSTTQDYPNMDVTTMVQNMVAKPDSNFGFIIKLDDENPYNSLIFCSPFYTVDTTKRPKLVINFTPPLQNACVSFQPGPCNAKSAYLGSYQPDENFGTDPELDAFAHTCNSTLCIARDVFQFDLSLIPPTAVVTSALLSLWYNSTTTGNPFPQEGNNNFHIYAIDTPWNSSTVTWNNQPSYDTVNAYSGAASTSSTQDYPNMNVTAMVSKMVSNPASNNGFIIKLDSEVLWNALIFCSPYYRDDPTKRPKLDVCYSVPTSIERSSPMPSIKIYPNPTRDMINIELAGGSNVIDEVKLYNALGQEVISEKIGQNYATKVHVGRLARGAYLIKVTDTYGRSYRVKEIIE